MTDTLRSICEQSTHLSNPQLDFIPQDLSRYKEIILRDLKELISAASCELVKGVVSLAGSILEAVLFGFLKGQETFIAARRGGPFILEPGGSLQDFVKVFNRYFGDQFPKGLLPDVVVAYRDLIHINREISSTPEICQQPARDMLRILDSLLGHLTRVSSP